ncbi:MAG: hypothetical protein AAFU67_18460, partial [Bacteroidota bacterium]
MASFWDQVKSIFQRAEESSPSNPAVHEMIERSNKELAAYQDWKRTLARKRLLDWLIDQYAVFRGKGQLDEAINFLDTPSSKGFVIHFYQTHYSKQEITHFFDYLKERVLELNYRTQISDRRVFNRKDWIETQERHYLKPRNSYVEGEPIEQRFGNITIELELRNDQVRN